MSFEEKNRPCPVVSPKLINSEALASRHMCPVTLSGNRRWRMTYIRCLASSISQICL